MLHADITDGPTHVTIALHILAPRGTRATRVLSAATFRVAAEIESLSADTDQRWVVAPNALHGKVTIELCHGDSPTLATAVALEACAALDIEPACAGM
jgi:hypothetical protein